MSFLVLDTETSGLPISMSADVDDLDNWPHVLQFGWLYCSSGFFDLRVEELDDIYTPEAYLIRPSNDLYIHPKAEAAHGLTLEQLKRDGQPISDVLARLSPLVDKADYIVCHNASFDVPIVGAEFIRTYGQDDPLEGKPYKCTMRSSTNFCRIPQKGFNRGGSYKWPTLQELHKKLFGHEFEDAHDAGANVKATLRCYLQLKKLKIMS